MFYKGRLRVAGDPGEGIPVDLSLDDVYVDLRADGEQLGRWRMDVVEAARLEGNDFRLLLDGEDMVFRAADPLGFAYNAVTTIEEISSRLKKRRRSLFRRKTGEPDLIRGVPLEEENLEPKPTSVSAERIKDLGSLLPPSGIVERPPPSDGLFEDFDVDVEEDIASVSFGTDAVVMPESRPAEPIVLDPSVFGSDESVEAFDGGLTDGAGPDPSREEPPVEATPFEAGLEPAPDDGGVFEMVVDEVEGDEVFDPADIAESPEIDVVTDLDPADDLQPDAAVASHDVSVGDGADASADDLSGGVMDVAGEVEPTEPEPMPELEPEPIEPEPMDVEPIDSVPMDAAVEGSHAGGEDLEAVDVVEVVEGDRHAGLVESGAEVLVEDHELAADVVQDAREPTGDDPIEASEEAVEPLESVDGAAPAEEDAEPETDEPEPLDAPPAEFDSMTSDTDAAQDADRPHIGVFDRLAREDEAVETDTATVAAPVAPPPPSIRGKRRLFGRSRGDQEHDHEYLESKTVGGITRRVCSVCGHVSFAGEDLYEGWK